MPELRDFDDDGISGAAGTDSPIPETKVPGTEPPPVRIRPHTVPEVLQDASTPGDDGES